MFCLPGAALEGHECSVLLEGSAVSGSVSARVFSASLTCASYSVWSAPSRQKTSSARRFPQSPGKASLCSGSQCTVSVGLAGCPGSECVDAHCYIFTSTKYFYCKSVTLQVITITLLQSVKLLHPSLSDHL